MKTFDLLGVILLIAVGGSISLAEPLVLGPAESRLQLAEIETLITGQYDNEPQRHYLEGMKRGASAPPRLNLQLRKRGDAPLSFTLEERDGSEHQAVARRGRLTLGADPSTREIMMTLEGSDCRWRWGRINGLWRAVAAGGCSMSSGELPIVAGKTWWLSDDELWVERGEEPVMIELGRARDYDCFVAIESSDSKPFARTGLRLHDRGGTVQLRTDEAKSRTLELTLRRGMWPSNSGNNLVELLTLYLQEVGAADVIGTGWATPDSARVGFGTGGQKAAGDRAVNARCKKID
jgi:hypothetical protein